MRVNLAESLGTISFKSQNGIIRYIYWIKCGNEFVVLNSVTPAACARRVICSLNCLQHVCNDTRDAFQSRDCIRILTEFGHYPSSNLFMSYVSQLSSCNFVQVIWHRKTNHSILNCWIQWPWKWKIWLYVFQSILLVFFILILLRTLWYPLSQDEYLSEMPHPLHQIRHGCRPRWKCTSSRQGCEGLNGHRYTRGDRCPW